MQVCPWCAVSFLQLILRVDRATLPGDAMIVRPVWDDFIADVLTRKMQRAAASYLCAVSRFSSSRSAVCAVAV